MPSTQTTPAPSPDPDAPSVPLSTASPASTTATTPIIIDFDGRQVRGELDGSPASLSLIDQLPLTLSFRDLNGQEKIAGLPAPLNLDGAPEGSGASPLTIAYWAPTQGFVLYYEQVGYFRGIVPIGTFENADAVQGQRSDFNATIRKAD